MIRYLYTKGEAQDAERFIQNLINAIPDKEHTAMTIAEYLEQKGMKRGIEQGMQKGEHEKAMKIAHNMLSKDCDSNFVKEVTGLSEEDIKKLTQNH